MQMNIKLSCGCCVRNVFVAIGEFLRQDDGPSVIVAVDVFEREDRDEEIGVVVAWDVHPTREQAALFRAIWDEESKFSDAVILHDAPSSLVSKPVSRGHELS